MSGGIRTIRATQHRHLSHTIAPHITATSGYNTALILNLNESTDVNLIFAGTPEFAASALADLIKAGHKVVAVYTQPDRPAGRGQKLTPSAVKTLALEHQIPVYQPVNLKGSTPEGQAAQAELAAIIKAHQVNVMVVAAYGLILPQSVLDMPPQGCLNIHASLLPRWRGAAPIHRAILSGDVETGITIMQMDAGLDTGDMLYRAPLPITSTDTSATLHDRLAVLGGEAIVHTLAQLAHYQAHRIKQQDSQVTYAAKLTKAEGQIDWTQSATEIDRTIRGLQPWPVAYTQMGNDTDTPDTIRIWSANLAASSTAAVAGEIIAISKDGVQVQCGDGQAILITSLQWPGGKAMTSTQILQTQKLHAGQRFL